jgi:hypothetical protein
MNKLARSLIIIVGISPCLPQAQDHPCNVIEAQQADTLRSWDALFNSYKSYSQCDDGAIGEGYSESVARILADHWSTLPRFSELASEKPAFRRFVIKHVDATLNKVDLETIKKNAADHCTPKLRDTCKDLTDQADRVLDGQ